tara:strand:+ start:139 stop:483 length:345 start_codon:yes stop_codon:yes gene_type:complete
MASRYDNKVAALNDSEMYKKIFKRRGITFINQYRTPEIYFPTDEEYLQLENVDHVWKMGDRYYKLAHQYYGKPSYWWLLAWYNQKPTESHLENGDLIQIPLPFDAALMLYMRSV